MKSLISILMIFGLCNVAFAYVLDFPGDAPPDPEQKSQPLNQPPSAEPNAQAAPNAELDAQTVLLLSMMSKEKLYALKLALDKMFDKPVPMPEPEPEFKDIKITIRSPKGAKTYDLKSPKQSQEAPAPKEPESNANIKIHMR